MITWGRNPYPTNHIADIMLIRDTKVYLINQSQPEYFEVAPQLSVNFISLVTSCVGLLDEEIRNSLAHELYTGISHNC